MMNLNLQKIIFLYEFCLLCDISRRPFYMRKCDYFAKNMVKNVIFYPKKYLKM